MSSIRDVAKKAGVSVSSVSLAYHKPHQLSDSTREKILKIATDMGYQPNMNKINKNLSSIMVMLPREVIAYSPIPLIKNIVGDLQERKYAVNGVEYDSVEDIQKKINSIKNDSNIKGCIISYSGSENIDLSNVSVPTIIISPHTVKNPCVNVGTPFADDIYVMIENILKNDKKTFGFVAEKAYDQLEYFRNLKKDCADFLAKYSTDGFTEDKICILNGNSGDFEYLQSYRDKLKPDTWLIVGEYALNIAQSTFFEHLEGFLIIEENSRCSIKPSNDFKVYERPCSKIADSSINLLMDMIKNNQLTTDKRIEVNAD